jgi:hypothetical protein
MTAAAPPLAPDLTEGLRRLKLAAMRQLAPELLLTAKTQRWTPEELLRTLVEAEISARDASKARTRLRNAAFPVTKTLALSGVDLEIYHVSAGSDVTDMPGRVGGSGLDAVLLKDPPQAEDLAVGGGEFVLEVADGGQAGGAFLAEPGGQGVHHAGVGLGWAGNGVRGRGAGGLPGAQRLDAAAQVVVGVEEVQADSAGAGDRAEADLLLVLDELADRGLGAGGGGLPLGLGGATQGIGPALRGGAAGLRAGRGDGRSHDPGSFLVRVTGTGPGW